MLDFSTKVKFKYKGDVLIGRICVVHDNDTYDVLTTGELGGMYKVAGKLLTVIPTPSYNERLGLV